MTFNILPLARSIRLGHDQLWQERTHGSAGLDVMLPMSTKFKGNDYTMVSLGLKVRLVDEVLDNLEIAMRTFDPGTAPTREISRSFLIFPRSSIAKHGLMLANSVGLIDADYRGELFANLYNTGPDIVLDKGTRLVQMVRPDFQSPSYKFVTALDPTDRGEGGYGSTGR